MARFSQVWFFCDWPGCEAKSEQMLRLTLTNDRSTITFGIPRWDYPDGWNNKPNPGLLEHTWDTKLFCPEHNCKCQGRCKCTPIEIKVTDERENEPIGTGALLGGIL